MSNRLLVAAATLALAVPALAGGDTFHVNDEVGRNSVTFTSEAPLEDIVGTTNQITGWLTFDPLNAQDGGAGELVVPIATLATGIPLRDEHLRSAAWLDAEAYPEARLVIERVTDVEKVKSGDGFHTFDVVAEGTFALRGQKRQVKIPARVTYLEESERTKALMPGDLLAVRAEFDVALADHGVSGPEGRDIIGSKVGETVTVEVSFRGSNADR
jgi:polyisoprenoid-binding protein YceI